MSDFDKITGCYQQSVALAETRRSNRWQGYLNWALHQDKAELQKNKILAMARHTQAALTPPRPPVRRASQKG